MIALAYWGFFFLGRGGSGDESGRPEDPYNRAAARDALENTLEVFETIEGRLPDSLDELVESGYIETVPFPGEEPWEYDPSTGVLR